MTCRLSVQMVLTGALSLAGGAAWAQPPAPAAGAGRGGCASNPNAVVPGEFVIEPPTLINLGFEWFIQGDDNRNAAVAVSYRKKGDSAWKNGAAAASPSGRAHLQRVAQSTVVSPNMFAGSILDLEPDTAYEARFVVSDPDGVAATAHESRRRSAPGPSRCRSPAAASSTSIRTASRGRRSSRRSKG